MKAFDSIIVHYDEIGLKGKNRGKFERLLISNIQNKAGELVKSIERESGQITIATTGAEKLKPILEKIPGIAFFSFAKQCDLDIKKLETAAVAYVKGLEYSDFRIDTKRHEKSFKYDTMEVNKKVGQAIVDAYKKKVTMKNPELNLKIEITHKNAYLSHESVMGIGGLPIDPKQKVVALLSGGFDSPVAAFMMMKRGCEVILVHFSNANQSTKAVEDKIVQLAKQLSGFQQKTTLYIVPFENLQKEIIANTKANVRMLIYRRFMLRIASKIARKNKARFLVVGDSLSQVSSQTIENLEATYQVSDIHVLSPLIGMNKREIMDIANQIGTHDISAMPYADCCTYFMPRHPVLNADKKMLEDAESGFDINKLVEEAVVKAKKSNI